MRANSLTPPDLPRGPTVSTFQRMSSLQYPWLAIPDALRCFRLVLGALKTSLSTIHNIEN